MYSMIQPPFALDFDTMTKKQLKEYGSWFLGMIPTRVAELAAAVRNTAEYAEWAPDMNPDSLGPLGEWFQNQVAVRRMAPDELDKIKSVLVFPIDLAPEMLTQRTLSLAVDIGIYWGETTIRHVPGARWEQSLRGKKSIDYGQVVVAGHGTLSLNPVRNVITLAYGIGSGHKKGDRLREMYQKWCGFLSASSHS